MCYRGQAEKPQQVRLVTGKLVQLLRGVVHAAIARHLGGGQVLPPVGDVIPAVAGLQLAASSLSGIEVSVGLLPQHPFLAAKKRFTLRMASCMKAQPSTVNAPVTSRLLTT